MPLRSLHNLHSKNVILKICNKKVNYNIPFNEYFYFINLSTVREKSGGRGELSLVHIEFNVPNT